MSRLSPDSVLGDTYRIVRRIGSGGMGDVYEATHARLAGRYAVKVLLRELSQHPDALERFRREARITSGLRHPNIVQVIDFNQTPDGDPYLVMEFLEGSDLDQRIAEQGPLPLVDAVDVIEQVASALHAAHRRRVVHRDLNPQNIFLIPVQGRVGDFVKLLDFGISKIRPVTRDLTQQSTVMGTPQYMSPEQALGHIEQIDSSTDQFALAAIAYEVLSGKPAFEGDSVQAILYQVVHEDPRPLALAAPGEVTARIEAVIRKGLSKRPADRFATVLELADELVAAVPQRAAVRRAAAARRARARARARDTYRRIVATLRPQPAPRHQTVTLVSKGSREAVESIASKARRFMRGTGRGRPLALGAVALGVGLMVMVGARSGGNNATAVNFLGSFPPLVVPLPAAREPAPVAAEAARETPLATDDGAPAAALAVKKARKAKERPGTDGDGDETAEASAIARVEAGPPGGGRCLLTVGSRPWSEVWIDGTPTNQHTPLAGVEVPCGTHRLRFKRDELRIDRVEVVTLREGEAFKRSFDLRGEPE